MAYGLTDGFLQNSQMSFSEFWLRLERFKWPGQIMQGCKAYRCMLHILVFIRDLLASQYLNEY